MSVNRKRSQKHSKQSAPRNGRAAGASRARAARARVVAPLVALARLLARFGFESERRGRESDARARTAQSIGATERTWLLARESFVAITGAVVAATWRASDAFARLIRLQSERRARVRPARSTVAATMARNGRDHLTGGSNVAADERDGFAVSSRARLLSTGETVPVFWAMRHGSVTFDAEPNASSVYVPAIVAATAHAIGHRVYAVTYRVECAWLDAERARGSRMVPASALRESTRARLVESMAQSAGVEPSLLSFVLRVAADERHERVSQKHGSKSITLDAVSLVQIETTVAAWRDPHAPRENRERAARAMVAALETAPADEQRAHRDAELARLRDWYGFAPVDADERDPWLAVGRDLANAGADVRRDECRDDADADERRAHALRQSRMVARIAALRVPQSGAHSSYPRPAVAPQSARLAVPVAVSRCGRGADTTGAVVAALDSPPRSARQVAAFHVEAYRTAVGRVAFRSVRRMVADPFRFCRMLRERVRAQSPRVAALRGDGWTFDRDGRVTRLILAQTRCQAGLTQFEPGTFPVTSERERRDALIARTLPNVVPARQTERTQSDAVQVDPFVYERDLRNVPAGRAIRRRARFTGRKNPLQALARYERATLARVAAERDAAMRAAVVPTVVPAFAGLSERERVAALDAFAPRLRVPGSVALPQTLDADERAAWSARRDRARQVERESYLAPERAADERNARAFATSVRWLARRDRRAAMPSGLLV